MDSEKKSRGYQNRIFWIISIFTWILTFAFFVLQYTREKEFKIGLLESQMQVYNSNILGEIKCKGLERYLNELHFQEEDSVRLSVIDFSGNIIYDSNNSSLLSNHSDRKEFVEAMNTGTGYMLRRTSKSDNRVYFYTATKGDSVIVRSAIPYSDSLSQTLRIDWMYTLVIVLIAVVVNVIAYFATRRLSHTIKNLKEFATKAEMGVLDLSEKYEFPQDELGDISATIVNLYINEQRMRKERDENVKALFLEVQEKQRIKHQLTNNINHEIKNPVHAIQMCLETIIENDDRLNDIQKKELQVNAYEYVKQLSSLLQDMSLITRMTDASNQIERTEVDLKSVIVNLRNEMNLYPIEKQMRLNINLPDEMKINGNLSLVESIFHNLMSNSLAYSGGRDIFISATDEGNCFMIEFADNGVGVDKEHLSKLFERFYRIDTGRSRKLGGTGLGLSIVKNAVLFHNGAIKVSNRSKGGLQFTFTLQK